MTVEEVIQHYGGVQQVADALGISYQAVKYWKDSGQIPVGRQWELQAKSVGVLRVENTQPQ